MFKLHWMWKCYTMWQVRLMQSRKVIGIHTLKHILYTLKILFLYLYSQNNPSFRVISRLTKDPEERMAIHSHVEPPSVRQTFHRPQPTLRPLQHLLRTTMLRGLLLVTVDPEGWQQHRTVPAPVQELLEQDLPAHARYNQVRCPYHRVHNNLNNCSSRNRWWIALV